MKDSQIEALLLGARTREQGQYTELTRAVMMQIKQHELMSRQLRISKKVHWRSFGWLRALHGTSLAVAIAVTVVVLTGVAYASVYFVPDLIKVLDKRLNNLTGRVEYSAPAFAQCYTQGGPKFDTFEVAPTAQLSDEDVEKTLRAKCELMGMNKFANDTWPTYGEHKEWKDGDTIFYTRPDRLGKVKRVTQHGLVLAYSNGQQPTEYQTLDRKPLEVYSRGERVGLDALKPGDYVYSMVRVSEVYHTRGGQTWTQDGNIHFTQSAAEPKVLGVVGVVKMTLPERYYHGMQQHVREVVPCAGNPGERCSAGPGEVGIDVFPRQQGEIARNPYMPVDVSGRIAREVSGIITSIEADKFTIITSKGTTYTIHLPRTIIDAYNTTDAPKYDDLVGSDIDKVRVHVGSWVGLLYQQDAKADRKVIDVGDITDLMLHVDAPAKGIKK